MNLTDGCSKCPQGKFSNDDGGHPACTVCATIGFFCPNGAIKEEPCKANEYCNGGTKQLRPEKPSEVTTEKVPRRNVMNVSWKVKWSGTPNGTFVVLYSTRKDATVNEMQRVLFDKIAPKGRRRILSPETSYEVQVGDLRVGTRYYARVMLAQDRGRVGRIASQPSELSESALSPCPTGAFCGPPGSRGVAVNATQNLKG